MTSASLNSNFSLKITIFNENQKKILWNYDLIKQKRYLIGQLKLQSE